MAVVSTRSTEQRQGFNATHLHKTYILGVLTETATAEHEVVLADDTTLRVAQAACVGARAVLAGVRVLEVGHGALRAIGIQREGHS